MGDVEGALRRDPGPPNLEAPALAPDRLPGRDVGHVVEVGDDDVGLGRDNAPEAEGQVEKGRGGRLMEADLAAGASVEEVGGESADALVQAGRLGFPGGDSSGHGIQPPLGVMGRLGRRIDGQAARSRVEVNAGPAPGIPVDHGETAADLRVERLEGVDGGFRGHGSPPLG
jgi:hypothetical protein